MTMSRETWDKNVVKMTTFTFQGLSLSLVKCQTHYTHSSEPMINQATNADTYKRHKAYTSQAGFRSYDSLSPSRSLRII